jgi:hypothetical protein
LDDLGGGISAAAVFAVLTQRCPENAIVSVDVGNNAVTVRIRTVSVRSG